MKKKYKEKWENAYLSVKNVTATPPTYRVMDREKWENAYLTVKNATTTPPTHRVMDL